MSLASGKIALVTGGFVQNSCGNTANPCSLPNVNIIDLVSYGASNNAEGGSPTNGGIALTNTKGSVRKNNGYTDTDNNNFDFNVVTNPVPRNSGCSIVGNCSTSLSAAYGDTALVPAYGGALGTKIPVILIHGIHGNKWPDGESSGQCIGSVVPDCSANPYPHYFRGLIERLNGDPFYNDQYKTYKFHYVSDRYSVIDLGAALRDRIDELIRANPSLDSKKIILVAHSMGGLVARSYMNRFRVTAGTDARFYGLPAGEKVRRLITLASPHHGSPLSNKTARVPPGLLGWNLHPIWSRFLGTLDNAYWGAEGCEACKTSLNAPNRSSLKWDDVSGIWRSNSSYQSSELNAELQIVGEEYTPKITAYYGAIRQNVTTQLYSNRGVGALGVSLAAVNKFDWQDSALDLLGVIQQRVLNNDFSESPVISIDNDGMVPIESGRYDRPYNEIFGPRVAKSVFCDGFNHRQMRDDWAGHSCTSSDGTTSSLFDSILYEILDTANRKSLGYVPGQLSIPSSIDLGYGTYPNGSQDRVLSIENLGDSPVQITSFSLSGGDSSQFTLVDPPALPAEIVGRSSLGLTLRFSPTSAGPKSAVLSVENNTTNPTPTVSLSGSGSPDVCTITFGPESAFVPATGGVGVFSLASIPCSFSVASDDAWIHPSKSGTTVNFSADANSSSAVRAGQITVSVDNRTYSLPVIQGSPTSGCLLNLGNNSQKMSANGSGGNFYVTTPSNCSWAVRVDAPWLTIPEDQGSRLGSGTLSFTADSNLTASTRYATIKVEGQEQSRIFTVSQSSGTNPCTLSLSSNQHTFPVNSGSSSVSIMTQTGCEWRVSSPDRWVNLLSTNNGTGNELLSFSVTSNVGNDMRFGTIIVSGNEETVVLSITQLGTSSADPDVNLPETIVNFGSGLIENSIYKSVVVQNVGSGYLTLGSIYVSSGSSDFEIMPFASNVLPDGSTVVNVKFTPTSSGFKSATVSISSNDPNETLVNFDVSGTGITQFVGGTLPIVQVPVTTLEIGDTPIGLIGETTLSVQNSGNAPLTLSYSQVSGSPDFFIFSSPDTLSAGGSTQLRVRYTPTTVGLSNSTFRISTNDPQTPNIDFHVSAKAVSFEPLRNGSWEVEHTTALPGNSIPRSIGLKDGKAYCIKSDNSLSIIDLATSTVQADIAFSDFPNASPGKVAIVGNKAFVALGGLGVNGQVAVVNRDTNAVVNYIPIGTDPYVIAASGDRIYVSVGGVGLSPSVKAVDTTTNSVVATISLGATEDYSITDIAIDSSLGRAYVVYRCLTCGSQTGSVGVVNLATNTIIATIPITSYTPNRIVVFGGRAYVSTDASVEVIDLNSSSAVARIMLPSNSTEIIATADFVLVSNHESFTPKVEIISTKTNLVVGELSLDDVQVMVSDPNTNTVYLGTASPAPTIKSLKFSIPAFSVSTDNQTVASVAGGTSTFVASVSSLNGWTGSIALSCEALPTGGSCQFGQNPIGLSANGTTTTNVILSVPPGTVNGPYGFRVIGTATTTGLSNTATDENDRANLILIVPTCSNQFAVANASIGAAGGALPVDVQGTGGCGWTASVDQPWVSISSGSSGTGNGTVGLTVEANAGPDRTANLTVNGQSITVTQLSGCTFQLGAASNNYPSTPISDTLAVTSVSGCVWTAMASDSWITITSGGSGSGGGTISFSLGANTGPARSGTITAGGQVFTINQAGPSSNNQISGAVTYAVVGSQGIKPISDVMFTASGTPQGVGTSDPSGLYIVSGLGTGGYILTPTKSGDVNGISSFDATLVLRYVAAGGGTLSSNQQVAADTNGNGAISSFDATQVLRFVAAGGPTGQTGHAGSWKFIPSTRSYGSLSGNVTGENFEGALVGEVNGNWAPPGTLAGADETDAESKDTPEIDKPMVYAIRSLSASPQATVQIAMPTNLTGLEGNTIIVPVTIMNSTNTPISSYSFAVLFDQAILQPATPSIDTVGTLSGSGFAVVPDVNSPGRLGIAAASGSSTIAAPGTLMNLRFTVVGSTGSSTLIFSTPIFEDDNGDGFTVVPTNGLFSIAPPTAGTVFISGRIRTGDGIGIRGATVTLTNSSGQTKTAISNGFGYYSFSDVAAGETYTIGASSKRYQFAPRLFMLSDAITELDLVAQPEGVADRRRSIRSVAQLISR